MELTLLTLGQVLSRAGQCCILLLRHARSRHSSLPAPRRGWLGRNMESFRYASRSIHHHNTVTFTSGCPQAELLRFKELHCSRPQSAVGHRWSVALGWCACDVTWQAMHAQERCTGIDPGVCANFVLAGGGGTTVDASDVMNTVWPRAAATTERLWSPLNITDIDTAAPQCSA